MSNLTNLRTTLLLVFCCGKAAAATLSFNALTNNSTYPSGVSTSENGVTVTVSAVNAPVGTNITVMTIASIRSLISMPYALRLDFSSTTSSLSVRVGDSGGDDDGTAHLEAFTAGGVSLGIVSATVGTSNVWISGWTNLTSNAAGASYYVFSTSGGDPNSLWLNISNVEAGGGGEPSGVPEPGTWAVMASGLGLLAWRQHRAAKWPVNARTGPTSAPA